jgi:ankyrin repeat protein
MGKTRRHVNGADPLCNAAAYGKLDVVRLLLREVGADISQLFDGRSALYAAAEEGHEHVVRALVNEFGANVKQVGPFDHSPLHAAALRDVST